MEIFDIGIIGMGVVGGTTAKVLSKIHKIHAYDKYKKEYQDIPGLINSEVVFICVPTPMKKSGEIDYSAIHNSLDFLSELAEKYKKYPLVIIRSTAVSGTTDNWLNSILSLNLSLTQNS